MTDFMLPSFIHSLDTLPVCRPEFSSFWRPTSSTVSFRAGILEVKPLSFSLPGKVSISPSLLKDGFARSSFPGWHFSSSTLNASPHSLSAYNVTAETPAENLTGAPLWQLAFFLLFSRFSLCLWFCHGQALENRIEYSLLLKSQLTVSRTD